MAREFMKNCRKVGIKVHGDFIIGLPGETKIPSTRPSISRRNWIAKTIQVSLAHAMPGTELHDQMSKEGFLRVEALADQSGHQLPHHRIPASFEGRHDGRRYALTTTNIISVPRSSGGS